MTGRRRYLQALGIATTTLLAGCSGGSDAPATGTAESDTATPGPTTQGEPTETDSSDEQQDEPGGEFEQAAKLAANDGDPEDGFGQSVAMSASGDTALVSAYEDGDPNGNNSGAVYVFARNGDEWTQQSKLVADDGESGDHLGKSVALSDDGTTALVGANGVQNADGQTAGAAYVFASSGGWSQVAKLSTSAPAATAGSDVALSGDGRTALVGASFYQDESGDATGAAYVFTDGGDGWVESATLLADDGDNLDSFGSSVALSDDGTTALVGAPIDEDPHGESAGSAYVFENGDGWSQRTKLVLEDGEQYDGFGTKLALSADGTTAVFGVPTDDEEYVGSAYVFADSGNEWSQQTQLDADDGDARDWFGASVALSDDGTTALIGASAEEDPNGAGAGAMYRFDTDGSQWRQRSKFTADDGDSKDTFGYAVALDGQGETAVISASGDEDPNGAGEYGVGAGSAYVFE